LIYICIQIIFKIVSITDKPGLAGFFLESFILKEWKSKKRDIRAFTKNLRSFFETKETALGYQVYDGVAKSAYFEDRPNILELAECEDIFG